LILGGKRYFVWKNASQSTKWLYFLNFLGDHGPFAAPGYAYGCFFALFNMTFQHW